MIEDMPNVFPFEKKGIREDQEGEEGEEGGNLSSPDGGSPAAPSTKRRSALAPPCLSFSPSNVSECMSSRYKFTLVGHLVVARQDVSSYEILELIQKSEGHRRQSVCLRAKRADLDELDLRGRGIVSIGRY